MHPIKFYSPSASGGATARTVPRQRSLEIDPKVASTAHIEVNILNGNVVQVVLKDRKIIDEGLIQGIGEDLYRVSEELAKPGNKNVFGNEGIVFVVDFKNLTYQSSAFVGKLITLDKKLKTDRIARNLTLCNVRPDMYEFYAITKLNKTLTVHTHGNNHVPNKDA